MTKIFFTTALLTINMIVNAQTTTTIVNQKVFGGVQDENFSDLIHLQNGNYLMLNSSGSGATGNKTVGNYGGLDFWLINLNSDFSINWQKGFGGLGDEFTAKVIEVSDGGYICIGSSNSTISGNKTAPNIGGYDYWIIKLNNLGNVEWEKTYGGSGDDNVKNITELANGDLLISGTSNSPISGDKTNASYGGNDYWLLKIDNIGNVIWDKTIGGSLNEELSDLFIGPNNSIYLSGSSQSNISGNKTENSYGQSDAWLLKLDNSANIIWDKTLGGSGPEFYPKMVLINNYLYVNSGSGSPVSGNKTAIPLGGGDFWLVKLDTNSNIIWDKSYGSNQDNSGRILDGGNGEILIFGTDNPMGGFGFSDYLIVIVDTNGVKLYNEIFIGDGHDFLMDLIYFSNNHFILLGSSTSDISNDKTLPNIGGSDVWLVEVTTNLGVNKNMLSKSYDLYPNPNKGSFTISGLKNNSEIYIYSIDGQLKKEIKNIATNELSISNTNLIKGIYIVKIVEKNNVQSLKFVVN